MLIRGKAVLVYDIEVFPNVFHCVLKNTETKKKYRLEISERTNDIIKIVNTFRQYKNNRTGKYLFCGFNCIHYDNVIINFLIANHRELEVLSNFEICTKIHQLSNDIVNSGDGFQVWHKWKHLQFFDTLDLLTMLYSQKLRVGLKEMQVTMQYDNVYEYEGDFNKYLPASEIDEMCKYNINDVESTEELLYRCEEDIKLRLAIEDEYKIKALSKDGVNLGMEIIKYKYLEATGLQWKDIKDLRSPCDIINLNEVILPIVSFKTPILQELLTYLKQQKVTPGRKGFEKHFLLDNLEYTMSVGGLHSVNKPERIVPQEGEVCSDIDAQSMYPSLIIEHHFYPPHLGDTFLKVYSNIKTERIEAKRNGDKVKNETLKLSLNGLSGNLQNEHSFCYSPKTVMQIRMNGQLMLLMLVERLIEIGCTIKNVNTDGVFVVRKLSDDKLFKQVCTEWEQLTKLTLEEDRFEAFYQFAINDYLAIKEGYSKTKDPKLLKKKGLFIDTVTLGKGMQPMIIPEAINKYLADGIPISETIKSCKDIRKFLTYQKVNKQYSVEYNNKLIARINRYYVSTNGYNLFKCKVDDSGNRSNYISMLQGYGVTIANKLSDFKELPNNINYQYYIKEANKIVENFKVKQLNLFDFI